ncbi:MAG: hypothetical protein AAB367_03145 [Patescibacteria group bacterium]
MNYQRSFTLLETIVAIYVLLAGIVGAMNLAQQNISAITLFRHQLIASNLAQEGAELVRNRRDSNALACSATGYTDSSCFDLNDLSSNPNTRNMEGIAGPLSGGTRCDDPTTGCRVSSPLGNLATDIIEFEPCSSTTVCQFLRFDSATGLYQYTSGDPTIFDRKITVTPIAGVVRDAGLQDWQVISTVTWCEKLDCTKQVTLREVLTPHMSQL